MSKKTLRFLIQGSAQMPYEVIFTREGEQFRSKCTCPAGDKKQLCKHVLGLINYMTDMPRPDIVSDNESDAYDLFEMFSGSDAFAANMDFATSEQTLKEKKEEFRKLLQPLEAEVKSRKKALQRILIN